MSKPVVAVCGATGAQGGSIVKSLLATGNYKIRGLTRNPDSDSAKKLAAQGVELVKVDLKKYDEVKKAFEGANIVFAVTNFWDPEIVGGDQTLEVTQGKLMADVAKEVGVDFYLWSSLPNCKVESNGKISHVVHFDGKHEVEEYIKSIGLPAAFVYMGFYATNIGAFFPLVKNDDGSQTIVVPYVSEDTDIDVVDISTAPGIVVSKILENKEKWIGKDIPIVNERLSFGKMAEIYTEVTGKKTTLRSVSDEEIAKEFPYLNNDELLEMCRWYIDYGYLGKTEVRNLEILDDLGVKLAAFKEYLQGQKAAGKL